jgi:hypothetical protein
MKRHELFITAILCVLLMASYASAQDTTLIVTNGGKVGIGLSNPAEKLHVIGSVQLDKTGPELGRLILRTTSQEDPGRYGLLFSNNTVAPFLGDDIGDQFYAFYSKWGNNRTYDAVLSIHGKATNSWGNVLKLTHDGTDGRISTDTGDIILNPSDGAGKVGIGTDNPTRRLHIAGANGSPNGMGLFANEGDVASFYYATNKGIIFDSYRPTDGRRLAVLLQPAGGKVGIGTDNPEGTLDVNGSIYQRGGSLHADYVFQPDYQLESIEEHSAFMWKHKHLKAIPKASNDENGQEIVEVGSHRKGIVEELEKAHIYIEQLHARINKLEATLEKLEIQRD